MMRTSPSHQRYLDAGCTLYAEQPGLPMYRMGQVTLIHFYGPCASCCVAMRDVDEHGYEDALRSPYTPGGIYGPADATVCTRCAGLRYRAANDHKLAGRLAHCSCGTVKPSDWTLPFFEYQGEGSRWQMERCQLCSYAPEAHNPEASHMARVERNGRTRYANFMAQHGGEHAFTPTEHGRDHDTYYCGCRGFD